MRANFGPTAVIAAVVLCLVQTAPATTMAPTPLPEMVHASPSIVHGTVMSTATRWSENGTMIVTDVTVQVHDALRGSAEGSVVFTQPGGTIGAMRVDVPGASAFQRGDEAVLFLAPGGDGTLYLYGLDRGRFAVTQDPASGQKLVRGLDEFELGALWTAPEGVVSTNQRVEGGSLRLEDFKTGIRELGDRAPSRDAIRNGGER